MVPESFAWAVSFVVPFAVVVALAYWTYTDAVARGSDRAWMWGVAVLVAFVVVVLYYLVRHDLGERDYPPTTGQRATAVFVLGTATATPLTILAARLSSTPRVQLYPLCVLVGLVFVASLAYTDALHSIRHRFLD